MIPIIVYFPQLDFSGFDAECSYKRRWKSIVEACWNWLCVIKMKKSIKFTAINHLIGAFPYVYALQMLFSMVLQLA